MSEDVRLTIGIWAEDLLQWRVLADALASAGYAARDLRKDKGGCRIIVACAAVPDEIRNEWQAQGAGFIELAGEPAGRRIRLGTLLQRIRQQAHAARALTGVIAFGGFRLDLAHMVLDDAKAGTSVNLTEKERDILARLYRANGRAVDRRTLLEDVWGYAAAAETHTLETHIYRLRQKLELDPASPRVLLTDETGYRLSFE